MFVNPSPRRWLADGDLNSIHLTHTHDTVFKTKALWRHNQVVASVHKRLFYTKNVDGRQIAKNRHIATPTTS